MPPKDKYTGPQLRDQVKEEIHNSDKGGAPGQWSARKAQFMAQEYKKRGGGYTTDKNKKDESQIHLDNWTEEEWQTKEGSGNAKKEDGTEKRYLPRKAWENMTEEEKEETDQKKQEQSKDGKQYVDNTEKAKQSRKKESKSDSYAGKDGQREEDDNGEEEQTESTRSNGTKSTRENGQQKNESDSKKSRKSNKQNGPGETQDQDEKGDVAMKEDDDEEEYIDDGQADANDDGDEEMADEIGAPEGNNDDEEEETDKENATAGQKRKADKHTSQTNDSSKKHKDNSGKGKPNGTVGSKHMDAEEPAPRGSKDKLPEKGQTASWKAMPGYVDGEVVDVLTESQEVDGKSRKASKEDPKVVLKSDASGKICVHKPDSCFYYI